MPVPLLPIALGVVAVVMLATRKGKAAPKRTPAGVVEIGPVTVELPAIDPGASAAEKEKQARATAERIAQAIQSKSADIMRALAHALEAQGNTEAAAKLRQAAAAIERAEVTEAAKDAAALAARELERARQLAATALAARTKDEKAAAAQAAREALARALAAQKLAAEEAANALLAKTEEERQEAAARAIAAQQEAAREAAALIKSAAEQTDREAAARALAAQKVAAEEAANALLAKTEEERERAIAAAIDAQEEAAREAAAALASVVVDPKTQLAGELRAHLGLGPLTGPVFRGTEDKALVTAFQRTTGATADGLYGPNTGLKVAELGIVPSRPFYFSKNASRALASKTAWTDYMEDRAASDPARAAEWLAAGEVARL